MRPFTRFLLAIALLPGAEAAAQESRGHHLLNDDWILRLGYQRADSDARVGLGNPQLGTIPVIDFEALGLDPKFDSAWAHVLWQAPERWSWGFNYFVSKAGGQTRTTEDIEFGNTILPAGTGFDADFSADFFVFNGYYDFYQRPNRSAGVGFGIYALDVKAEIQGFVDNEPGERRESADTLAPLPTASLYYKHAFNDKWAFWADLGYFSLEIDKYDGELVAARMSLEYWFHENWGVGAGYTFVDLELTIDEPIFDEFYDVEFDSAFIFLTYGF